MIIQELLELLINANEIGLEVSELERGAIFLYEFGDSPEGEKEEYPISDFRPPTSDLLYSTLLNS